MIKTVTLTGGEMTVSGLGGFNTSVHNLGSLPIYASAFPGIAPEADNVAVIPAGAAKIISTTRGTVYLKGTGKAELTGQDHEHVNFRVPSSVGGGGESPAAAMLGKASGTVLQLTDTHSGNIAVTDWVCNLMPYPYETPPDDGHISWTVNSDGSIHAVGTAGSSDSSFVLISRSSGALYLDKGTYSLSGCPADGGANKYKIKLNIGSSQHAADYGEGSVFTVTGRQAAGVLVSVAAGHTVDLTFRPMLEAGSAAHAFVPPAGYEIVSADGNGGASAVHVDRNTPSPVYGLSSYEGVTNISNTCGAEITAAYPLTEDGRLFVDTARNIYDKLQELTAAIIVSGGED